VIAVRRAPIVAGGALDGPAASQRGPLDRLRVVAGSIGAALLGAAPHVLHHAGPLAAGALLSGAGGTLLFGALGLLASIPMLRRLHRHTGSWAAPGAALALFAVLFTLSSLVIGPAITGTDGGSSSLTTDQPAGPTPSEHEQHHR
jgi:hypothetical protein